jgi:hypothetical protein
VLGDPEVAAPELEDRQQRHGLPVSDAVRFVDGNLPRAAALHELVAKAALAGSRLRIVEGNVGRVTFDAACAWLGVDAARARRAILGMVPRAPAPESLPPRRWKPTWRRRARA